MALTDSLVSYWKLDESSGDASDATANVKTLTNTGTTTYAAAKINNGADFGTANTTKYLSRTGYIVSDGALSFSLWIKQRTEISSGTQTFIMCGSESTALTLSYDYNAGTRRLQLIRERNNLSSATINYTITLGTSNFYHIVGSYNGSLIILYVNGTAVSTASSSLNGTTNWSPGGGYFVLGAKRDANDGTVSSYSSSYIDEVAVYSRAITDSEVSSLYNIGYGATYPFTGYSMTTDSGTFSLSNKTANIRYGNLSNLPKPTNTINNVAK